MAVSSEQIKSNIACKGPTVAIVQTMTQANKYAANPGPWSMTLNCESHLGSP